MLSSAGTVSADAGAAPLAVTVSLQDAAGMASATVSTAVSHPDVKFSNRCVL